MVVSEIGEQWSPQTAPARQAEMEMINNLSSKPTPTTIGNKIPNVPQEVPVAKARNTATRNTIAGKNKVRLLAPDLNKVLTNTSAPRSPVIPLKVHAKVKIKIAGTIALKPSGIADIHSSKVNTLRQM